MQAIITKFHSGTDTTGARISATSEDGTRVYVSFDYGLNVQDNHFAAVRKLAERISWHGVYVCGSMSKGYVWVWLTRGTPMWDTESGGKRAVKDWRSAE